MAAAVADRVDMSTIGQVMMDFVVDCFLENVSTKELSALLGAITSIANEAVSEDETVEVEFWLMSGDGDYDDEICATALERPATLKDSSTQTASTMPADSAECSPGIDAENDAQRQTGQQLDQRET